MDTKTVAIGETQIVLYRCRRCQHIPTWISNQVEHRKWHRRRDELARQLLGTPKEAANSRETSRSVRVANQR